MWLWLKRHLANKRSLHLDLVYTHHSNPRLVPASPRSESALRVVNNGAPSAVQGATVDTLGIRLC